MCTEEEHGIAAGNSLARDVSVESGVIPVLVQLLSGTGASSLAWEAAEILAHLTDPASRAPSSVIAQPTVVAVGSSAVLHFINALLYKRRRLPGGI